MSQNLQTTELIEELKRTDPRIIIKENMKLLFVIGYVFTREDQILFDNILDFFDNTQRTYLDVEYDVTTYEDKYVQSIEDKFEIGNGNYHLMMLIVNPHNNNVNHEPYLYIEEITDFIIDLHQKYGSVNNTPKKQVSNLNRQANIICFNDYPTHHYIDMSTGEQNQTDAMYRSIQTRGANDKTYYKNEFDLGFEFTPVDGSISQQLNETTGVNERGRVQQKPENKPHNRFKHNNLNSRIREDRTRMLGAAETNMESFLSDPRCNDPELYREYDHEMVRNINHGYYSRMYNNDEYNKRELNEENRVLSKDGVLRYDL